MATILIVEDEFAIADLLEMVLLDEGYLVLKACNGLHGLEQLAAGSLPDLIISDYMMPVLDGVGMLQRMQDNEAQRAIPYIVMSSMPEENVRRRMGGYTAFIHKPFDLWYVVSLVASILVSPDAEPKHSGAQS